MNYFNIKDKSLDNPEIFKLNMIRGIALKQDWLDLWVFAQFMHL